MKRRLVSVLLGTSLLLSGCGNTEARTYSYNANDTPKSNYTAAIEQLEKSGGTLELLDEFGTGDGGGSIEEGEWNPEDDRNFYGDYDYGYLKHPDWWQEDADRLTPDLSKPAYDPDQALANMPLFAIPKEERTEEQWDQIFEYAASQSQFVYDEAKCQGQELVSTVTSDKEQAVVDFTNQIQTGQLQFSITKWGDSVPGYDGYEAYRYVIDFPTKSLVECSRYTDLNWATSEEVIDPATVDISWIDFSSTWNVQVSIMQHYGLTGQLVGLQEHSNVPGYFSRPVFSTDPYRELPYMDFLYNGAHEEYVVTNNALAYATLSLSGLSSNGVVSFATLDLRFNLVIGDTDTVEGCFGCVCGCEDESDASCEVGGECSE